MSELMELEIDLKEVVQKYRDKGVQTTEKELLALEEKGDLKIFMSPEDCFFWVNDCHSSLAAVVADWLNLHTEELAPYETMMDYALRGDQYAVLDSGEVIFLY